MSLRCILHFYYKEHTVVCILSFLHWLQTRQIFQRVLFLLSKITKE